MKPPILNQSLLKHRLLTLALLGLLGLCGWLSTYYPLQVDVTANASNTLSEVSQKLLVALPGDVKITAYLKKGLPLRLQIAQLIDRYHHYKKDLALVFVDPDNQPEATRELEIGPEGAVLVEYQGHTEKLSLVDESTLTNALMQLAHSEKRWVSFLTGHGERAPDGDANSAYGQLGKALKLRNIIAQPLNLTAVSGIPDNSMLLVIADPSVALLPGELDIIKHYIDQGGNLLLLGEPDDTALAVVQEQLGIQPLPGAIVDNSSRLYGIKDPRFVIANSYPSHPITRGLELISLYPFAAALSVGKNPQFQSQPLLESSPADKAEHGQTFAYALTRNLGKKEQRVVAIGDSDFLSNAYLGSVGNLDVGLRIINWLLHNDEFVDIPARAATDKSLQLSLITISAMGFGYLLVLPLLLAGTGVVVWIRRKRLR